jgi:WD40 repeat protein
LALVAAARIAAAWDLSSPSTKPAWTATRPKRSPEYSDIPVLSSDGTLLALLNIDVVGRPNELRILDAKSGRQRALSTFAGYFNVTFAPNNRSLAAIVQTGSAAVAIVDSVSGAARNTLTGLKGGRVAVFSPDGQLVAVPTGSGVSVWDVASGDYLGELDGSDPATTFAVPSIDRAVFLRDGKRFVALDGNQSIITWYLDTDHLVRAACTIVDRDLTRDEWSALVSSGVPYERTCTASGIRR